MKTCTSCMTDKEDTHFYKSLKVKHFGTCIDCAKKKQREAYQVSTHFRPAKTYQDYLKEQGMFEYYRRYVKNF